MDFMTKTEVTYSSKTYSAQTEYKMASNKFTSSGSWSQPQRLMSYNTELSSNNGKMVANSDFSWDSKKV